MSKFQVFSDLTIAQQKEVRRIQAITEARRLASEAAYLVALAPYLTNQIILEDEAGLIVIAAGNTVPDEYEGFKKGALFIELDSEGNGLFTNVGDESESDFDSLTDIDSAEIADGAVSLDKLDVDVADDVTLELTEAGLAVKSAAGLPVVAEAEENTPINSDIASGTVTSVGDALPTDGDSVVAGSKEYTFVAELTEDGEGEPEPVPNEVLIGASGEATLNNLRLALAGDTGEGTNFSTGTTENEDVGAPAVAQASDSDFVLTLMAKYGGEAGNVPLTEDADNITVSGSGTLLGGVDGTPAGKGTLLFDDDNIYLAVQENTVDSAVWREVAHSSLS